MRKITDNNNNNDERYCNEINKRRDSTSKNRQYNESLVNIIVNIIEFV